MLKKYFDFIKSMAYVNECEWQCAIREIDSNGMLFEGNLSKFTLIPNSTRYWHADPFLFEYKGKEYIFVEMYDRKQKKGVIGYARIGNKKKLKFKKCLELPYHLSYPCVYEQDGEIYMLPECYQSGYIATFKCVSFPNKWVEDSTIIYKIAADTTPFDIGGRRVYFSTFYNSMNSRIDDNLFLIDGKNIKELKKNDYVARSAGKVFTSNNKIIRPSQDCKDGYGLRLLFSEIESLTDKEYVDKELCFIYPPQNGENDGMNRVTLQDKSNHEWRGIHTYNFSNKYEIIDLKYADGKSIYAFNRNLKKYLKYKFSGGKKGM